MKNEKNKILNKIWFEALTIGLIFIILGFIVSYVAREFNLLYIIGGVELLACVNIPTSFTIDDNGMCVYYLFRLKKQNIFGTASNRFTQLINQDTANSLNFVSIAQKRKVSNYIPLGFRTIVVQKS